MLNLTDICNLRCKFCEIHYVYKKFEKRYSNFVDIELIKNYSSWLQYMKSLAFYGATGEPLLAKNFTKIVKLLKTKYGTALSVNTNGTLLNEDIANVMVEYGFDDVLVSIHAGKEETYNKLVGGDYQKLLSNIEYLAKRKNELNRSKHSIGFTFALNKINSVDAEAYVRLAKKIGVDYIQTGHYYDVRNKLPNDVSFYFNPEEGNRILDRIYNLAQSLDMPIRPATPPYLHSQEEICRMLKGDGIIGTHQCYEPWTTIKFKGCVEHPNSHYITPCNRIMLFRINYKEYNMKDGFNFIWNHPTLQYLRKTANSTELNPICAFCRNSTTPIIRCVDNKRYRRLRDNAVREFFSEVRRNYDIPQKYGLYLLDKNPYE
ncbi:MAG: hypothetical protein A7315_02575 [Candidatus Altiarchaeales archaeon WOR_SM1_79]|nr:MAG: hypothetical protein A7315_02575 [Candidatus Altiarchaeales archaeon WOR_SM1_79]